MDMDFYQFTELIDIMPERGSHFIHSMSEPFSEEDLEDEVLHNWLDHFGMQFHQLHASGHLSREHVQQLVKEVDAKNVFPVHTENASLFKETCSRVKLTKRGKQYIV